MQGFKTLFLMGALCIIAPYTQAEDDWEQGWDDNIAQIPVVLTATRMRQSQLDTPASVTIIDADTIERMGFRDIEDVFRLVPGMPLSADINVGERTVISYFLRPILRGMGESFRDP